MYLSLLAYTCTHNYKRYRAPASAGAARSRRIDHGIYWTRRQASLQTCFLHACFSIHGGGWLSLVHQPLVREFASFESRNREPASKLEFHVGWPGWTRPPTTGGGGGVGRQGGGLQRGSRGYCKRVPNALRLDSLGEL